MITDFVRRIRYWQREDRISPENPLTHWRLYFRGSMTRLCRKRFKHFGENAELRPHVFIAGCSNISIGKDVVVRPNSILFACPESVGGGGGSITIEDGVLLGPSVKMFTSRHRFADPEIPIIDQGMEDPEDIVVRKGCWIGAGAIILPGVTIGEHAVVGAGSVVTRDVPARTLAVGVPARVIPRHDEDSIVGERATPSERA